MSAYSVGSASKIFSKERKDLQYLFINASRTSRREVGTECIFLGKKVQVFTSANSPHARYNFPWPLNMFSVEALKKHVYLIKSFVKESKRNLFIGNF